MQKTIITMLGMIGHTNKNNKPKISEEKAQYSLGSKLTNKFKIKEQKYINMLDVIVSNYKDEKIIAIGTQKAIDTQKEMLKYLNVKDINIKYIQIKNENKYDKVLELINNQIIENENVIFDVSHGFRHLPILATVSLIVQNIQNSDKVEEIIYAKEETAFKEYEIISLKEYLELANLSFIISNFKDNYTISSLAKVSNQKYNLLLVAMRKFSRDILALSMQHFFHKSLPRLNEALNNISKDFILKNDLNELREHLKIFDFTEKKRYQIYFETAKELMKKEYILQSVNLLHEAKRFYVKTSFKNKSEENYFYIDEIENKIDKEPDNYKNNIYQLLSECIYIYVKKEQHLKKERLQLIDIDWAKSLKRSLHIDEKFKKFLQDDLRNKLSHANSDEEIKNVKGELAKNIQQFEQFCIINDVLKK
jgi:CRISPR-associated DxTHG motif protein